MALIDSFLVPFDPGVTTLPFRTSANSVCCVVEGSGEGQGRRRHCQLEEARHLHAAATQPDRAPDTGGTARLFQVSDRDIYARLGLLKEEYGNNAA